MSYRYIARRVTEHTEGTCSTCGEPVYMVAVEQCKTVDRTDLATDGDTTRVICRECAFLERNT